MGRWRINCADVGVRIREGINELRIIIKKNYSMSYFQISVIPDYRRHNELNGLKSFGRQII